MAASNAEIQDRYKLYKYTKELTLKVAQIVVQSRQGKKITSQLPKLDIENFELTPPPLQWFDLSIPDEPKVNEETKHVLNGEVVDALTRSLCIEISLRTSDGDEMVLELWTVKLMSGIEICSLPTVYYRMSVMLKSTLSISRITPAYKLARSQNETYKIYHKIYGGEPNYTLLGEKHKTVRVSELHTPIGTLLIEVVYRTKMSIVPEDGRKVAHAAHDEIMLKSDHFNSDSPRKTYDRKATDLSKPLTAGAFVDAARMEELRRSLSRQLPPEPPLQWLLAEKEKMEQKLKCLSVTERDEASTSSAHAVSTAIEMPKKHDKYTGLMDFPFADGSPIAELASFYQECVEAKSLSGVWGEGAGCGDGDGAALARQLRHYEDAVPEFDSMLASMLSASCSDHSEHSSNL